MSAPTVTPDTSKDLSSYDMIKDDNGDTNISDAGISLSLDSSVSLQIHYTLSGDAYSDITPSITVDGEYLGANDVDYSQDGGEMIATIKNIPATKFGHVYEIVVGDNGYTVNASVLTYAHKLKVSSVENIAKQFACALYEYYASTMNYKGLTIE